MRKLTIAQIESLGEVVNTGITKNFYLAGGTAITIKYGHRFSEDFDFFTFPETKFNVVDMTIDLDAHLRLEYLNQSKTTLIFTNKGVKFSFFDYKYKVLENPVFFDNFGVYIASDMDIAAMKVVAVAQRGSKKDFFDLWFLMKRNFWSLETLRDITVKKYPNFNFDRVGLKSLIYFEDAEREIFPDIEPFWQEVKEYFYNLVYNNLRK